MMYLSPEIKIQFEDTNLYLVAWLRLLNTSGYLSKHGISLSHQEMVEIIITHEEIYSDFLGVFPHN